MQTETLVKFNAREALGEKWNPRASFEMNRGLNGLQVGQVYEIFEDKDPKEVRIGKNKYKTCITGDGIQCLPPILGKMLIADQETDFLANKEFEEKFHCAIPAHFSEKIGKEIKTLGDLIDKDGHFPKFRVVAKYIVAIDKEAMKNMQSDRKIEAHRRHHGEHPHQTEKEWLPQCDIAAPERNMQYNIGKITHLYQLVVELV